MARPGRVNGGCLAGIVAIAAIAYLWFIFSFNPVVMDPAVGDFPSSISQEDPASNGQAQARHVESLQREVQQRKAAPTRIIKVPAHTQSTASSTADSRTAAEADLTHTAESNEVIMHESQSESSQSLADDKELHASTMRIVHAQASEERGTESEQHGDVHHEIDENDADPESLPLLLWWNGINGPDVSVEFFIVVLLNAFRCFAQSVSHCHMYEYPHFYCSMPCARPTAAFASAESAKTVPCSTIQVCNDMHAANQYICIIITFASRIHHYSDLGALLFYGSEFGSPPLPLPRLSSHVWALYHEESPMNNWKLLHPNVIRMFNFTSTYAEHSSAPVPLNWAPSSTVS